MRYQKRASADTSKKLLTFTTFAITGAALSRNGVLAANVGSRANHEYENENIKDEVDNILHQSDGDNIIFVFVCIVGVVVLVIGVDNRSQNGDDNKVDGSANEEELEGRHARRHVVVVGRPALVQLVARHDCGRRIVCHRVRNRWINNESAAATIHINMVWYHTILWVA